MQSSTRGIVGLAAALAVISLIGCAGPERNDPLPVPTGDLSLSPAGDAIYECLRERGWDVTISWDGGVEANSETVPTAQRDLFLADSEECGAQVDERIASMQPDEIVAVYAQELATRECLISLGYDVESPPSEQAYLDRFFGERWSAYGATEIPVGQMTDEEWMNLNIECPQPAWALGAP